MKENVINKPTSVLRVEHVVIGSGPGGALTACLRAEAGQEVLMLEEGAFLQQESCVPFSQDEMVSKYRNGGVTVAMGNPSVSYVEGRCVGGGSEINSGLYYRLPEDIREVWQQKFNIEAFGAADLLPHYEAIERDLSVGPWQGQLSAASLKLKEGADKLGWKAVEVPRCFRYDSASDQGPVGKRQSMTRTYIPRALKAGARLLPHAKAMRISRQGTKWHIAGKMTTEPRESFEIEAESVSLACGAIQTPVLLMRSGLASGSSMNFRFHPTVKVVARFNEEINFPGMGVPVHQVKEFAPAVSLGCSISAPPFLALSLQGHAFTAQDLSESWRHMAVYYAAATGGVGRISLLPFFEDPLVTCRLSEDDLKQSADALRRLCQCLLAAGARDVFPVVEGLTRLTSPEQLSSLPACLSRKQAELMTVHLMASCPSGENREACVTDSWGHVFGQQGLWVADASLLPGAPGINIQGPVMAIVRRNVLQSLTNK